LGCRVNTTTGCAAYVSCRLALGERALLVHLRDDPIQLASFRRSNQLVQRRDDTRQVGKCDILRVMLYRNCLKRIRQKVAR